MEKILKYFKFPKHLIGVILSILLMMTTFSTYIPEKVFKVAIYIPQLIMFLYAIYLFVLYFKKTYRPKYAAKILFVIIIFFTLYYIFITGYRAISGGNPKQSLSTALITFTSVVLFFLIDASIIRKKEAFTDLIIIITLINIMQIIMGLSIGSIRQSSVLLNIMVYTSVMLFIIPFTFYIIQNRKILKIKKFWGVLSWINLFFILIFIPASGSRSGFIMLIITLVLSMIINYKRKTRFLIKSGILYFSVVSTIFVLFTYNIMNIRAPIMRQIMTLNILIEEQTEIPAQEQTEIPVQEQTEIPTNEQILESDNSGWIENQKREYQEAVKIDTAGSDSIRMYLWEKSIQELKKKPLIGTGTFLFEVEYNGIKFLQGSHNIILELSLIFGIIGMVIFLCMVATPIIFIVMFSINIRSRTLIREMLNYLLSIVNVFVIAMVQPVLIMAFPVMLLWLISGIMYSNGKNERNNTKFIESSKHKV